MSIRVKLCLAVLAAAAPYVCMAQSVATLNRLQKGLALRPDLQNGEHLFLHYCASCHQRQIESLQSLRDVSAYVANRPRNPGPDHGDATALPAGERIYVQSCAICHEKSGEGNRDDLIPAIGGQQYGYLRTRLENFAQQHATAGRGSMEPAVINLLAGLSPAELKAVADYTSRLTALRAH